MASKKQKRIDENWETAGVPAMDQADKQEMKESHRRVMRATGMKTRPNEKQINANAKKIKKNRGKDLKQRG